MPYSAVSQPSPRALEERRHALLDARRAQHARVADLDQHRAFGVPRVAARDAHGRSSSARRPPDAGVMECIATDGVDYSGAPRRASACGHARASQRDSGGVQREAACETRRCRLRACRASRSTRSLRPDHAPASRSSDRRQREEHAARHAHARAAIARDQRGRRHRLARRRRNTASTRPRIGALAGEQCERAPARDCRRRAGCGGCRCRRAAAARRGARRAPAPRSWPSRRVRTSAAGAARSTRIPVSSATAASARSAAHLLARVGVPRIRADRFRETDVPAASSRH